MVTLEDMAHGTAHGTKKGHGAHGGSHAAHAPSHGAHGGAHGGHAPAHGGHGGTHGEHYEATEVLDRTSDELTDELIQSLDGARYQDEYRRVAQHFFGYTDTLKGVSDSLKDPILKKFKSHELYETLRDEHNHNIGKLDPEHQHAIKRGLYKAILHTIAEKHHVEFEGDVEDDDEAMEQLRKHLSAEFGLQSEKQLYDMVDRIRVYDDETIKRSVTDTLGAQVAQKNLGQALQKLEDEAKYGDEGRYDANREEHHQLLKGLTKHVDPNARVRKPKSLDDLARKAGDLASQYHQIKDSPRYKTEE